MYGSSMRRIHLMLSNKEKKTREREAQEKEEPPPEKKQRESEAPYFYDPAVYPEFEVPKEAEYSGKQSVAFERQAQKKGTPGSSRPIESSATSPSPSPIKEIPRAGAETESEQGEVAPTPQRSARAPSEKTPEETTRSETFEQRSDRPADIVLEPKAAEGVKKREEGGKADDPTRKGNPSGGPNQGAASLFPNASNTHITSTEVGNDGTFNFLEDVPEEDRTMIDRKRNRYWTYWDRMTRQIKKEWAPGQELRKRDPYGNVYGVGTYFTLLLVTLNTDGSVRAIAIQRTSKLDFLDDEAVRAFNAAGPFPNPPEGLKDEDGLIHIRFGFVLESSNGEFKLFRVQPKEPF